jgi:predicted ribosome quality control (RQC) complex YloA/Tae2 family protein
MREEITSLDLHYLLQELQVLIGGKVDKIYEKADNKKEFMIRFHVSQIGKKQLKILVPNYLYLTEYKEEFPQTPPGYCAFLRKYLTNSRLLEIKQVNFERILELTFQTKNEKLIMIIELFSKGNVILCREDYKIMSPLENQNWKDRTIRGGIKYEYPPAQINTKEIKEIKTNKEIVKYLATDLGFGGLYAEYLCKISKIDKNSKKITELLLKNIKGILNKKIKANLSGEEILPIEIEKTSNYYKTFNEALDENLTINKIKQDKSDIEKEKKEQLSKKEKIIKDQEQRIKGLEKSAEENQKKGEAMYENYQELNKILIEIRELRKKLSWKEIKKKYPKININEKEGTISVKI